MYIRTNDGVYLKIRECDENNKILIVGKTITDFGTYIEKKDIITQSENLEELCDLYIDEETQAIFHKHNGYVINWKTNMVYSLKALSESYHSVKGAIYTYKGLIYVAKMNDKGELCLL